MTTLTESAAYFDLEEGDEVHLTVSPEKIRNMIAKDGPNGARRELINILMMSPELCETLASPACWAKLTEQALLVHLTPLKVLACLLVDELSKKAYSENSGGGGVIAFVKAIYLHTVLGNEYTQEMFFGACDAVEAIEEMDLMDATVKTVKEKFKTVDNSLKALHNSSEANTSDIAEMQTQMRCRKEVDASNKAFDAQRHVLQQAHLDAINVLQQAHLGAIKKHDADKLSAQAQIEGKYCNTKCAVLCERDTNAPS